MNSSATLPQPVTTVLAATATGRENATLEAAIEGSPALILEGHRGLESRGVTL